MTVSHNEQSSLSLRGFAYLCWFSKFGWSFSWTPNLAKVVFNGFS